jgi:hypothetical protein
LADCNAARRSGTVTPVLGHAGRIDLDDHGASWAADGIDFAGAGDSLEVYLNAVGDTLQVERADRGVLAEQRDRHDGHVIDALGLDQRAQYPQAPWAANRHWN